MKAFAIFMAKPKGKAKIMKKEKGIWISCGRCKYIKLLRIWCILIIGGHFLLACTNTSSYLVCDRSLLIFRDHFTENVSLLSKVVISPNWSLKRPYSLVVFDLSSGSWFVLKHTTGKKILKIAGKKKKTKHIKHK